MQKTTRGEGSRVSWLVAALVFAATALAAASLAWYVDDSRSREYREESQHLATDHAHLIQTKVDHALSATHALAALVRQGRGQVADFDAIAAEMLPLYPGAASLQLAPDGVVRQIVPLEPNRKAIGHNLFQDPKRGREARLARDTGNLTLAGPFTLIQGGVAAAGRLPVYLDDGNGKSRFWGLVVVLVRFPEVLDRVELGALAERGFRYELWRTHPDSGEKQVFAVSPDGPPLDPVTATLEVPNATWTLGIAPRAGWDENRSLPLLGALGLLFSLLLAWLAKLLVDTRHSKRYLEARVAERTAELQRFAEITAHHLQEPARRSATYAGLLRGQLANRVDDPEVVRSLDVIVEQANHLQDLLRDVERYLAAEAPRGTVRPVNTAQLVATLADQIKESITTAQAELCIDALPSALIDPPRLNELFLLALKNALDHGHPEGHPLRIEISGERIGNRVRYRIRDNGPGVAAEYRERVFLVFERLAPKHEGTGIGLSIIRRIARSAGGDAFIEEAPRGGCCLVVELPSGESSA